MLKKRLLNNEEAYSLWQEFGEAVGLSQLKDSYGEYWPRKPLPQELVFEWFDEDEQIIGWSAIRPDPLEPVFWIVVGIFPDQRNKGYSKEIFWSTIDEGFRIFKDVEWCWSAISKKNKKPFSYTKRETQWSYVGEMIQPPPGYTLFGIRRGQTQSY